MTAPLISGVEPAGKPTTWSFSRNQAKRERSRSRYIEQLHVREGSSDPRKRRISNPWRVFLQTRCRGNHGTEKTTTRHIGAAGELLV